MTGTIIHALLAMMGVAMLFMLTMRILFFGESKEADPLALNALTAGLKKNRLRMQRRLGWLEKLVDESMGDLAVLRCSVEKFRCRVERFHSALVVVANTAMGVGFFGTVASIASMAGGQVELPIIIGVGMRSTMVGLVIAQPGIAYHGLTDSKVMRFLDQIDAVLQALDEHLGSQTVQPVVPPNVPLPRLNLIPTTTPEVLVHGKAFETVASLPDVSPNQIIMDIFANTSWKESTND